MVENLLANARVMGLIPGLGRSHMLRSNEVQCRDDRARGPRACAPRGEKPHEKPGATARRSPTHCNPEEPASSREDPAQPRRNGFYKLKC